jgi:flagellar biogenesis protein FliO
MMPTVRFLGASRRHATVGLIGVALAVGVFASPARGRLAPPATTVPTANASISVGSPAGAPAAVPTAPASAGSAGSADAMSPPVSEAASSPATDQAAEQRREYGRRPLGGVSGPAVGRPDLEALGREDASVLPPAADATGGPGELIRVGAALGAVLAIAVIAARIGRRFGGGGRMGRPAGVLEIMARYPVGRGQHLLVLRFDRRLLLVHQAGGRMERIAEVAAADEVASLLGRLEAGASGGDADRFRRALADFEHGRGPEDLRPDGLFPSETGPGPGLAGPATSAGIARGGSDRAAGLAAAIRAARRRVAYGNASAPAPTATRPAAGGHAPGRTARVELVDLTRGGGRR